MKTIIHTYKGPHQWKNSPPGLGDFIRGTCHLFEMLENKNVKLKLDVSAIGLNDHLVPNAEIFHFGSDDEIASAQEYFTEDDHAKLIMHLIQFLNSDQKILYISTNIGAWNRLELPHSTKRFMQVLYQFSREIEDARTQSITPRDYAVLSIRCGDTFFRDHDADLNDDDHNRIRRIFETQIRPHERYPIAVTSDNFRLKQRFSTDYNCLSLPHRSEHGAISSGSRSVALDLCLLKHARSIYHINLWAGWWSGFSHYTSLIFSIPSLNFRAPHFVPEHVNSKS